MWFSSPVRPNSLEQEAGGIVIPFQTLPEETSGEVCALVHLDENTVSSHLPLGLAEA